MRLSNPRSLRTVFASLVILSFLSLTVHSQAFCKGSHTPPPTPPPSLSHNDGAGPAAGLIMDASGNLYGTTATGGAYSNGAVQGNGTVFKLTPPATGGSWTESILHSFNGTDGTF